MNDRPSITPEMVERFAAYFDTDPTWGSLHIVLADDNVEDHFVDFCIEYARKAGDVEGEALAHILRSLSRSQRGRIDRKVTRLRRGIA